MDWDPAQIPDHEGRTVPRTNVFIAASMYAEGVCSPVKIRNLSGSGALIETSAAPVVHTDLRLSRGNLLVSGKIAWSVGNRCGVRFDKAIEVRDWMSPPANVGQGHVDLIIAQVRSGSKGALAQSPMRYSSKDEGVVLAEISSLIQQVAEALASDALVVSRFPVQLQMIDKALQLLQLSKGALE